MLSNAQIITKLKSAQFTNEDGFHYRLKFKQGLTFEDIQRLANKFPNGKVPEELKEILLETRGWEDPAMEEVNFTSIDNFGMEELFPYSITLGSDGLGNPWLLDINSNGKLGAVYFACHDPATIINAAKNLNEFLSHLLDFYLSPDHNHLDEVREEEVFKIQEQNQEFEDLKSFSESNPDLVDFTEDHMHPDHHIIDYRKAKVMDGFTWGHYSPEAIVARHPELPIWIINTKNTIENKTAKPGLIKRLFNKN